MEVVQDGRNDGSDTEESHEFTKFSTSMMFTVILDLGVAMMSYSLIFKIFQVFVFEIFKWWFLIL